MQAKVMERSSFERGIHFVRKSAGMLASGVYLRVTSPRWRRCLSAK